MSGEPATGIWARKVCPPGAWTVWDLSEELGLSLGETTRKCRRWGIGRVRRFMVRLPGRLRTRYLRVLTAEDVREFKERHAYGSIHRRGKGR